MYIATVVAKIIKTKINIYDDYDTLNMQYHVIDRSTCIFNYGEDLYITFVKLVYHVLIVIW